jgi:ferredoxin-NADP reductase
LCLSRQENIEELVPGEDIHHIKQGRIMHVLDSYDEDSLKSAFFYLCGGKEVVESMRQYLADRGIERTNIHFEKFT